VAAGLEELQAGRVSIAGRVVAEPDRSLPPEERGVGLVFQDYALFPHLRVLDNVQFGLRRMGRQERHARALDVLGQVAMGEYATAYPHMLSGGQQQRVALARALAPGPVVMLLDEPFGGLDRRLREQVREDTLRILKESGSAVLFVTHDPEEAMAMGDRIAIMAAGRIEQVGTPREVYRRPASPFVARFLGDVNAFAGVVHQGQVTTPLGLVPADGLPDRQPVDVLVRPEHVLLSPAPSPGERADSIQGVVREARLLGPATRLRIELSDSAGAPSEITALQMGTAAQALGDSVGLAVEPDGAFVFRREG
jgi:iron(III) transport system ATP-binding protein